MKRLDGIYSLTMVKTNTWYMTINTGLLKKFKETNYWGRNDRRPTS